MIVLAVALGQTMSIKMVGVGSQYGGAFVDSPGKALDGSKTYKLHLPGNIPTKNFRSFVLYDNQTRSMLAIGAFSYAGDNAYIKIGW